MSVEQLKAELLDIALQLPPSDLEGFRQYLQERIGKLGMISLTSNQPGLMEAGLAAVEDLGMCIFKLLKVSQSVTEYAEQL